MEEDKCIEEIATLEEVDVIDNTVDTSQFITKDVDNLTYYTTTNDLENNYVKNENITDFIKKSEQTFKYLEDSEKNIWELEEGNYVTKQEATIYLQQGSSVLFDKGTIITIHNSDEKIAYYLLKPDGHIYYGKVDNQGTAEENGNALIDLSKTLALDNDIEYEVTEDYNPAHKKYVDDEVGDCYYNLEKNINEENNKQTIMNIRAKDNSYSQVMCVDNLDLEMPIPTVDVLSAAKGRDLDTRLKALETKDLVETSALDPITSRITNLEETPIKVIEISSEMSEDNKTNHEYPQLELNEDQVQIVLNNNISILKVSYNITGKSNGTETDTLVFYTTIDDEKIVSGVNTVDTIKINAIRRNNEGILVYHGEMMGDGKDYYKKVTLTATYNANSPVAIASNVKQSIWS